MVLEGRGCSLNKYLEKLNICFWFTQKRGNHTPHMSHDQQDDVSGVIVIYHLEEYSMWRSILCPPPCSGGLTCECGIICASLWRHNLATRSFYIRSIRNSVKVPTPELQRGLWGRTAHPRPWRGCPWTPGSHQPCLLAPSRTFFDHSGELFMTPRERATSHLSAPLSLSLLSLFNNDLSDHFFLSRKGTN